MATVKTKLTDGELRIITKDGKVSCSCCEEDECCMYPADLLGSTYGASDLPDDVTVNWTNRFTGGMSKSGSGYAGGGATLQIVNGIWRLSDSDGTRNVGRCLIRGDGNLTQGDDLVEDQFEDAYTVTVGSTTGTVTRESLCVWRGLTTDGCPIALSYDRGIEEIEIDAAALKWAIRIIFFDPDFGCSGSGSIFIKAVQNSPAGSDYIDNNIFSNATASVS
jgi:hypothetical protein